MKDFSRKIAKAVLSPREDIDERLTTGTEGGGEDVYEVVERYKQELEQIISTLAPTYRTTGSSGGPPRSRSVRKAWEEAPSPGSDSNPTSQAKPKSKGRSKGERTRMADHGEDEVDERELRRYQESLYRSSKAGRGGDEPYYEREDEDDVADSSATHHAGEKSNPHHGTAEAEDRVFETVYNFGKQVNDFKERMEGGDPRRGSQGAGGPPTVEANLTEDYFFEMDDASDAEDHEDDDDDDDEDDEEEEAPGGRKDAERGGMEGFGAAGSAELASRSYNVGRDRNVHIHPSLALSGGHAMLTEDEVHSSLSEQNGQVSVNAVELDAIQQELQGLREWKQNAEESITRLHHQLNISHQAVFDLTEKMRLVIEEQKSVRQELRYQFASHGKAEAKMEPASRDLGLDPRGHHRHHHHHVGREDPFRPSRRKEADHDHRGGASEAQAAEPLQKHIEEVKAKVVRESRDSRQGRDPGMAKKFQGLSPRKEGRKQKAKMAAQGKAKASTSSQVGGGGPGLASPSEIIDRVPKSLEGALEAVHALRPFDGGMSAPSSQLQGPLDMGPEMDHSMTSASDASQDDPMDSDSDSLESPAPPGPSAPSGVDPVRPKMARGRPKTAQDKANEVELDRQWSLEHYLEANGHSGHLPDREAAGMMSERDFGVTDPSQGPNARDGHGGVHNIVLPSRGQGRGQQQQQEKKTKDYWLEEMLGVLDQEFLAMQDQFRHDPDPIEGSPKRAKGGRRGQGGAGVAGHGTGGSAGGAGKTKSILRTKAKGGQGPKTKGGKAGGHGHGGQGRGKKKKFTFAESLGNWKSGLRGSQGGPARPKSATAAAAAAKKRRAAKGKQARPKTASRYMRTT